MMQRKNFRIRKWSWNALHPTWPWAGEMALIFLGIAALFIMIALLKTYDGRAIFDWNGVTLNTVVAVLSVVMKASLTAVAATCLGQWKWILFSRERYPILDFEKIDRASRGSWGIFSVLTRKHGS